VSKALDLRESQVRALIRAAQKEGARLEVKVGGAVVTILPDIHTPEPEPVDDKGKGYL
jgi:hypothetical protein